jgi:Na+/melibiose symporter-like transporter
VFSAAILGRWFEEPARPRGKKPTLDLAGAALLTACVLAILGAADGARARVLGPTALLTLAAFLFVERRAKEPILPLSLFRDRAIAVSSAVVFLLGAVMMGSVMYTPFYVQAVRGGTPTDGGTTVAPMLIGWPIASALAARFVAKVGFRPLVRTGLVLLAASASALAWAVGARASLNVFRLGMFVMGGGMGLATLALLVSIQEAVDWTQRGVVTASSMFFRTIGGALAVGALGALLARGLSGVIPEAVLQKMLTAHGETGAAELREAYARYADAVGPPMAPLFGTLAALALAALVVGLAFPDLKVKPKVKPAG